MNFAQLFRKLLNLRRGRAGIAVADQLMISGANFLASIVLVRGLGLSEFGKYAILYGVLLYVNELQMAFIAMPMLCIGPLKEGDDRRRFTEGMLALQILASILLFAIFLAAGSVASVFTTFYSLRCLVAYAVCVGTFQLQDWVRRFYFLQAKGKLAFVSDFISYVFQLFVLGALWRAHSLSLFTTLVTMCVTSAAATVMIVFTDSIRPVRDGLRQTWALCKTMSRDLVFASQVRWFGNQGILIIGTGIVGSQATGGLRASQSLAGPVNIILSSLGNVLPLRIAEELKARGVPGAYRFVRSAIFMFVVLFSLIAIPVAIFGRTILGFVYGKAMVAFYYPMLLQLGTIIFGAVTRLWFFLYRGIQETKPLLWSNGLCAIVNIGTVYTFGHLWNASGLIASSLLGQAVAITTCIAYWQLRSQSLKDRFPVPEKEEQRIVQAEEAAMTSSLTAAAGSQMGQ
ncbi:MAG TPA: hypothetical protein VGL89_01650 [Candidatus Koribacter sp.]